MEGWVEMDVWVEVKGDGEGSLREVGRVSKKSDKGDLLYLGWEE